MKLLSLRRGEPETRSHYERARDGFKQAKGDVRSTERVGVCPTCDGPMLLRKSYKGKDSYKFEGICYADPEHSILRYGRFVTDPSAPGAVDLDGGD